jgi:phosphoribosyl 1,2-cyclic phosphodiesterase
LSNEQAADLLYQMNRSQLKHVLISHISEKNNETQLALDTIAPALDGFQVKVELLTQNEGCDWVSIAHRR